MVDSPRFMATLRIFCKYLLNGDGPTKFIDLVIRRSGVVRLVNALRDSGADLLRNTEQICTRITVGSGYLDSAELFVYYLSIAEFKHCERYQVVYRFFGETDHPEQGMLHVQQSISLVSGD